MRGAFIYLGVAVAFVLVLGAGLFAIRPDAEDAKIAITDLFEENTGCYMEVDSVQPDGMLLPAIRMSGLRLFAPDGDQVAKLRWLQADLSISDLISGGFGLASLQLVEPEVSYDAFPKCFEKMHFTGSKGAQTTTDIQISILDGMFHMAQSPIDGWQSFAMTQLSGAWDGRRHVKLAGWASRGTDFNAPAFPIQASLRMTDDGVDRMLLQLLDLGNNPDLTIQQFGQARKLAELTWKPEAAEAIVSFKLDQAADISFFEDSPVKNLPLSVKAVFNASGQNIETTEFEGVIGEESFEGSLSWQEDAQKRRALTTSLNFGVLDQDFATSALATANNFKGFSTFVSRLAQLDFELGVGLTAAGISAAGGEMAQAPAVHFVAGLGSVTLDQMNIGLPGGTEVSILADYTPATDSNTKDWFASGNISIQSENIRRSLRWLGYDPVDVSTDYLRNFRLTAGLELDHQGGRLNDFDIAIDRSQLNGVAEWARVQDVTADIYALQHFRIEAGHLDVDAYRVDTGVETGAGIASPVEILSALLRSNQVGLSPKAKVSLSADRLIFSELKHEDVYLNLSQVDQIVSANAGNIKLTPDTVLTFTSRLDQKEKRPILDFDANIDMPPFQSQDMIFPDTFISLLEADEQPKDTSGKSQLQINGFGALDDAGLPYMRGSLIANDPVLSATAEFEILPDINLTGPSGFSWSLTRGYVEGLTALIEDGSAEGYFRRDEGMVFNNAAGRFGKSKFNLVKDHENEIRPYHLKVTDFCLENEVALSSLFNPWLELGGCVVFDLFVEEKKERLYSELVGEVAGPISIAVPTNLSGLPAGTARNLAAKLNKHFPADRTSFKGDLVLNDTSLFVKEGVLEGVAASGELSYSLNKDLNRVSGRLLVKEKEPQNAALFFDLSGSPRRTDVKVKGAWLTNQP